MKKGFVFWFIGSICFLIVTVATILLISWFTKPNEALGTELSTDDIEESEFQEPEEDYKIIDYNEVEGEPVSPKALFYNLLNAPENQDFIIEDITLADYPEMHYPQLVSSQGRDKDCSEINQMIEEQLKLMVSEWGLFEAFTLAQSENANPELSMDYEIKSFNQNFLSVLYTVVYYNSSMPHPMVCYFTLNLDLEEGKYVYLEDMIYVDAAFWNVFFSEAKEIGNEDEDFPWFSTFYPQQTPEGVEELKFCDSEDFTQNTYPIFSYYENGKVYLCFPREYGAGSYGVFELETESTGSEVEKALRAYEEFIAGERCVGSEDIVSMTTPTGEPEKRYATDYTILDVNEDGIPELHIRNGREFNVISYKNEELYILASRFSDPSWQEVLKSGALMGYDCRHGEFWHYFQLDKEGNEINEVKFCIAEKYIGDTQYEFEYKFEGELCTKEEWYAKTREYLYTDEEGREQIRDTVDWINYCEAK